MIFIPGSWGNKYNDPKEYVMHKQNSCDLFLPELRQFFAQKTFFLGGGDKNWVHEDFLIKYSCNSIYLLQIFNSCKKSEKSKKSKQSIKYFMRYYASKNFII